MLKMHIKTWKNMTEHSKKYGSTRLTLIII